MHTEQQNIKKNILVLFIEVFKKNKQFQNPYDQWITLVVVIIVPYCNYDHCSLLSVLRPSNNKKKQAPRKGLKSQAFQVFPSSPQHLNTSTPHLISESRHAFRNAGCRDVAKILGETETVAGFPKCPWFKRWQFMDDGDKVKVNPPLFPPKKQR